MSEIDDIKRRAGIGRAPTNDDLNPQHAVQTMHTELLLKFLRGDHDIAQVLKQEMANRGLGQDGKWVGFEKAEQIWK